VPGWVSNIEAYWEDPALARANGLLAVPDLAAAGARILFPPKYSPDVNPAEQVFAKLKTVMRKAGAPTPSPTPAPNPRPIFSKRMRRLLRNARNA
jgi:transposase